VIVVAVVVKLGRLAAIDQDITRWMVSIQRPELDAAAGAITFFGSSPWCLAAMGAVSLWWWQCHQRALVGIFWGAWLMGVLIQVVLRLLVGQWRPDTTALPASLDLLSRFQLAGFPSGHAFRSAFLYGWGMNSLSRSRRWTAQLGANGLMTLIVLVGLTRIYLQRHWFSDVMGAWLVAAFVLAVAQTWRERLSGSRRSPGRSA